MKKVILYYGLLSLVVSFFVSSCVNQDYDLQNINTEVTVGSAGLAFPLGSTQKLGIKNLIESGDDNIINKDQNGGYYIKAAGGIALDNVTPDMIDFTQVKLEDLTYTKNKLFDKSGLVLPPSIGEEDFEIPGALFPSATIATQVFDVEFKLDLPDQIKEIRAIHLNKNAKVKVSVCVKDPFISEGTIIPAIDVDLSDFIEIDNSNDPIHLGELVLNDENNFSASKVYSVTGLNVDFTKVVDYKHIVKSSSISGSVSLTDAVTNRKTLEASSNMSFEIVVSYIDLNVEKVEAKVDYKLDEIKQNLDMSSLVGLLQSGDNCLDLYNPYILLDIKSNIGIPVLGTLSLLPFKGGAPVPGSDIELEVEFPYSESSGKVSQTIIWIGEREEGVAADAKFMQAKFANMISIMPDSVLVAVSCSTDPSKTSVLEIAGEYNVGLDYSFVLPLAFGDKFKISVSDTLDVSEAGLQDFLRRNSVQLLGSVNNTFPLNFEMQLTLLDAQNNVIPSDHKNPTIYSCNKDGSVKESVLDLLLAAKNSSDFSNLSKVKITFIVTSKGAEGVYITDESYLQAKLSLKLPEGITLGGDN